MRFDQLPTEMILKIAAACEPTVERELKYTSGRINEDIEYYLKDRRASKISIKKIKEKVCFAIEVAYPKFRKYGTYTQKCMPKKSERYRFERLSSVEDLYIEGYDALSMFKIDEKNPTLKGFTRLRKIGTLSIQKCPMDYSREWCDQIKRIVRYFGVENLEVGGFQIHGVALPVAEAINMLDVVNGNMVISYSQRTPSYYDDEFLVKLVSKPRNRLCIGEVSTKFTYGAVLRTIKKILLNGWKGVDWNLGSIQLNGKRDLKNFIEHRTNLIDFAKKQLDIELTLETDARENATPYLQYLFKDEKSGSCIKFGTENVIQRSTILFNDQFKWLDHKEVFYRGNYHML